MDGSLLAELAYRAPTPAILADILTQFRTAAIDPNEIDTAKVRSRLTRSDAAALLQAAHVGDTYDDEQREKAHRSLVIRLTGDRAYLRELAERAMHDGAIGGDEKDLLEHPSADDETRLIALSVADLDGRVDESGKVTHGRSEGSKFGPKPRFPITMEREQQVIDTWFTSVPDRALADRVASSPPVDEAPREESRLPSWSAFRLPTLALLYAAHPLLTQPIALSFIQAAYGRRTDGKSAHYQVREAASRILTRKDVVRVLSRDSDGRSSRALLNEAVDAIVDCSARSHGAAMYALVDGLPGDGDGARMLRHCCTTMVGRLAVAGCPHTPPEVLADLATAENGSPLPVPGATGPIPMSNYKVDEAPWPPYSLVKALAENPNTPGCVLRTLRLRDAPSALPALLADAGPDTWAVAARMEPPMGITAGRWADMLSALTVNAHQAN